MTIALTGGIGSGKTFVCRLLEKRGVRVYDCDAGAKRIIREDGGIREKLSRAVGEDLFASGRMNKTLLSRFILSSGENAAKIDDIVHPAVARDFLSSGLDWLESAILFESGFARRLEIDLVVCVAAPEETRLRRIMERDRLTREKAAEWIALQMPQDEKIRLSDYVVANGDGDDAEGQIDRLLEVIGKREIKTKQYKTDKQ